MSTLIVTRCQVWLAQVPMSDDCRQTLRKLLVVPGQLLGPEAEKALEHRKWLSQASEAWSHWGRGMGPPAQCSRKCCAQDPQCSHHLNPLPQPWQHSQVAVGSWCQPRGEQPPSRRPQRVQGHNQRPPKPSIDLKDAYFNIPIHTEHRKFLCLAFQGLTYQFGILLFGLSLAPHIFTRCMRTALTSLCLIRIKIILYLDDWLICALLFQEAE